MSALLPLLVLLAAPLAPTQKSTDAYRAGAHKVLLEAGGDKLAVTAFGGSSQRIAVAQTSATGGATGVSKTPPVVGTSVNVPLVPGAGLRTLLEQAFAGGAAGSWLVREIDVAGQELFVHQLDGVRLRGLQLANCDLQANEPAEWSLTFDVQQVRLTPGNGSKASSMVKSKSPRFGGVRVIQEGKELEHVLAVEGLRFDFPASEGKASGKPNAYATLPDVLRIRLPGNDVKPWLDKLGSATAGLEVELLDASEAKPTVAARVSFDQAQLVAVARPCSGGSSAFELEYRCAGPRLEFP